MPPGDFKGNIFWSVNGKGVNDKRCIHGNNVSERFQYLAPGLDVAIIISGAGLFLGPNDKIGKLCELEENT